MDGDCDVLGTKDGISDILGAADGTGGTVVIGAL